MPKPIYKFEVDWDHDELYAHAQSDITADVPISDQWSWETGRSGNSSISSKSQAGRCQLPLLNDTGKYSSLNSASPLFGLILPGRRVRISMGIATATDLVWSGRLDRILPSARIGKLPAARLTALGVLATVAAAKSRTRRRTDILTSDACGVVLDDIGWPAGARDINVGQTTMTYWFFSSAQGTNAVRELQQIEDTESGLVRESEKDEVVFEDRHFRLSGARLTSQKTYADDGTAGAITYQEVPQSDPIENVFNRITGTVPNQSLATLATLWTLAASGVYSPVIGPGETQRFIAEYPTPDAVTQDVGAEWTIPVSGTDFTFNSQSDGGGNDLVANLTVTATRALDIMVISVTNAVGKPIGILTLLQARGQAVQSGDSQSIEEFDQDSIDKYGDREFQSPARFLPNMQEAVDHVRYKLALHKDIAPTMGIRYLASKDSAHLTEAFTRHLSDRITVKSDTATKLGITSSDQFVEKIGMVVIGGGAQHWVNLVLSPADATGKIIVFDTGPGLDIGVMGH